MKCLKCGKEQDYNFCTDCSISVIKKPTIDEMYSLNWRHILLNAINSRETSWGHIEKAMIEYRNAGDCLAGAVIDEMKKKGLIENK